MWNKNVDNVDNLVDSFHYWKPVSTEKYRKFNENREFDRSVSGILCKCLIHEKIHMLMQLIMLINMWIMWITLSGKQIFPYFQHISGTHSYQQVPVHTFFQ